MRNQCLLMLFPQTLDQRCDAFEKGSSEQGPRARLQRKRMQWMENLRGDRICTIIQLKGWFQNAHHNFRMVSQAPTIVTSCKKLYWNFIFHINQPHWWEINRSHTLWPIGGTENIENNNKNMVVVVDDQIF